MHWPDACTCAPQRTAHGAPARPTSRGRTAGGYIFDGAGAGGSAAALGAEFGRLESAGWIDTQTRCSRTPVSLPTASPTSAKRARSAARRRSAVIIDLQLWNPTERSARCPLQRSPPVLAQRRRCPCRPWPTARDHTVGCGVGAPATVTPAERPLLALVGGTGRQAHGGYDDAGAPPVQDLHVGQAAGRALGGRARRRNYRARELRPPPAVGAEELPLVARAGVPPRHASPPCVESSGSSGSRREQGVGREQGGRGGGGGAIVKQGEVIVIL
eukprot:SAG11_NODE_1113_length_5809_cov_37.515672_7_plen_272_part_00